VERQSLQEGGIHLHRDHRIQVGHELVGVRTRDLIRKDRVKIMDETNVSSVRCH
jgi:hypothetical protein